MHSVAAYTRSRISVAGRIQCKNVAVCRMSAYADSYGVYAERAEGAEADGETPPRLVLIGRMEPTGLCPSCQYKIGYELDIVAVEEECAVCLRPMLLGVKWNADACRHRFCPACTHQMLFGMPRPTYESYQSRLGDLVELHDDGRMVAGVDTFTVGDGRTSCPMCRATRKPPQWMEPTIRTVTCIWLYGHTGTGKTRAARDDLTSKFGERGFYVYDNPREFVGYNLECGMLVDDYDPADIPEETLLSILSGEARYVDPGRGAERLPLLAEFVYVTSLLPPERYFAEGSPVLALLTTVRNL